MHIKIVLTALVLAAAAGLPARDASANDLVARLEALVLEQQKLIADQGQRLARQEQEMARLSARVDGMRRSRRTILLSEETPGNTVTSGSRDVRLAVSGQVNRAINVLDDGHSTDAYHVDNNLSNSRIRFIGTGRVNEDVTVGARLEAAISPNNSGQVDQENQNAGDFFDQRITDVFIESATFGRLSIGKGFSASDGTAEVDLSGTTVAAYASWSDLVSAIRLFDDQADALSTVTIGNVFGSLDGLGRQNRIAYETPRFFGVNLVGGANVDESYDGAIRWAGQGHGFKAAAAGGIADFGSRDPRNYRLSGSASVLHEATGLNLTLSGGMDERRDANGSNLYAKVGWLASLFETGSTAFSVDVARSENLPTGDDDGVAVGGAVVQHFDRWGADLYSQFRWIDADRRGAVDFEDVTVGTAGVRVKF
ncbi:MAG: porin [Myxococcota bacterium]